MLEQVGDLRGIIRSFKFILEVYICVCNVYLFKY